MKNSKKILSALLSVTMFAVAGLSTANVAQASDLPLDSGSKKPTSTPKQEMNRNIADMKNKNKEDSKHPTSSPKSSEENSGNTVEPADDNDGPQIPIKRDEPKEDPGSIMGCVITQYAKQCGIITPPAPHMEPSQLPS